MLDRFVIHVLIVAVVSMLLAGCDGSDSGAPTTLLDGTPATELSVALDGVDSPDVLTSVTTSGIGRAEAGSAVAACLGRADGDRPSGPIVVRIGVSGESVTFGNRSGHGLYGCDNSEGPREGGRRWCGVAFGQLSEDRLRDPRLDLGACKTKDGTTLGFAWVEPAPSARYVALEQGDYVEVYETSGALPVRVTTNDVDIERSNATFHVSEHASDGSLVRRYRLEASVAG